MNPRVIEEFNTIQEPSIPDDILTEHPDSKLNKQEFPISEILNENIQGEKIALINRERLQHLGITEFNRTITCYYNKYNQPIVELRNQYLQNRKPTEISKQISSRAKNARTIINIRESDSRHIEILSALLEREGVIVSAATAENPYGQYASSGLDITGKLQGYSIGNQTPTSYQALHLTEKFVPQAPQTPRTHETGLNFIHTNSMAVALYNNGQWSPTYMIPSSQLVSAISNNAGLKYAFGGFEGVQTRFGSTVTESQPSTLDQENQRTQETVEARVTDNGTLVFFRLDEHAKRMQHTAKKLGMPELDVNQFMEAVIKTAQLNINYIPTDNGQLYFSICLFGTRGGAGASQPTNYVFSVEAFPFGNYQASNSSNISLKASETSRSAITGDAKAFANYGPNFREKNEAKKLGYTDILCLDQDGNVEEVSSSAPIFIQISSDGEVSLHSPIFSQDQIETPRSPGTPIKPKNSLNSITRNSIFEIANRLGYTTIKRDIHHTEIPYFQGLITTGTAAGITKVGAVGMIDGNKHEFDNGTTEIANTLYQHLMNLRQGFTTDTRLQDLLESWIIKAKNR